MNRVSTTFPFLGYIISLGLFLLVANIYSSLTGNFFTSTNEAIVSNFHKGPLKFTPKKELVIAYCVFPQKLRPSEPVLGAEWMAKVLGPLAFPDFHIVYKSCLAVPEQLPKNTNVLQALELLGILDVNVRFCSYGSSKLIESTLKVLEKQTNQIRISAVSPFFEDISPAILPKKQKIDVYTLLPSNEVIGPMITRTNRESWIENVPGVALQFDTKNAPHLLSLTSVSVHMPYAIENFGRSRWNGGDPNRIIEPHEENFGSNNMNKLIESGTRKQGFDSMQIKQNKIQFMAMLNSNCGASIPTSKIRGLFGYAVYEVLQKPVHNIGLCPKGNRGTCCLQASFESTLTIIELQVR